jgi:hypothetical protein
MAIAHAHIHPGTDYLSVTREYSFAANVYGETRKAKPVRIVQKPVTPHCIEITPVFVGIAG